MPRLHWNSRLFSGRLAGAALAAGLLFTATPLAAWQQDLPGERSQRDQSGRSADAPAEQPDRKTLGLLVAFGEEGENMRIVDVRPGSPAERAGFEPGDELVSIEDQNIESAQQLRQMIQDVDEGEVTHIAIVRDGQPRTLVVKLFGTREEEPQDTARRPRDAPPADQARQGSPRVPPEAARGQAWLGVALEPSPDERGALVWNVYPGSPAARAELQAGDVIVGINGQEVDSVEQLMDQIRRLRPGTETQIAYMRRGQPQTTTVALGSRGEFERDFQQRFGERMRAFRPGAEPFDVPPGLARPREPSQEQHQQLEATLAQVLEELRQLRQEVQQLRGQRGAAQEPITVPPEPEPEDQQEIQEERRDNKPSAENDPDE